VGSQSSAVLETWSLQCCKVAQCPQGNTTSRGHFISSRLCSAVKLPSHSGNAAHWLKREGGGRCSKGKAVQPLWRFCYDSMSAGMSSASTCKAARLPSPCGRFASVVPGINSTAGHSAGPYNPGGACSILQPCSSARHCRAVRLPSTSTVGARSSVLQSEVQLLRSSQVVRTHGLTFCRNPPPKVPHLTLNAQDLPPSPLVPIQGCRTSQLETRLCKSSSQLA
jgi:hypothetical protein